LEDYQDRLLMIQGQHMANQLAQMSDIHSLKDVEFKVYSQWGEDGILAWLTRKLPISSPKFVEFGVENYCEANTRFLLRSQNWRGLVLDCEPRYIDYIRNDKIYWMHDLSAIQAFITRDNINDLIINNGFSGEIGILSIDVDGNDYWIWEAINCVKPDIVICEYNAILGDIYQICIPYQEDFQRWRAHYSGLYFGASIKALEGLASQKNYVLIGSNSAGCNAFFVHQDVYPLLEKRIQNQKARPSTYRDSRDQSSNFTFLRGMDRFEQIKHLPVWRIDIGAIVNLASMAPLYSEGWMAEMAE
jgi:hypothetical protein